MSVPGPDAMRPGDAAAVLDLSQLLVSGRADEAPVAFGRDDVHRLGDLRAHVGGFVERIAATGPGRWLLYSQNSYAFAAALLALAHADSTAILPPNGQPGTLRALARDATGAFLDGGGRLRGHPTLDPLDLSRARVPLRPLDRDAPFVEMFTSGTTAEHKAIPKALRHLTDELRVLESTLGTALGPETRVFATVPHHHVYGLLFRVLWPLAAGRPFAVGTFLQPEELLPRLAETDDCALVSSPAHLRRLAAASGLGALRGKLRAVYCSGAPLDPDTALGLAESLGQAPVEIFGSTETGGVAWRQQAKREDGSWTPLPEVAIERATSDERLVVRSPFVSVGERFTMGDRVEQSADGTFRLLGRADRVVKIGEKRLALPDMEAQLRAHDFVDDVALAPIDSGSGTRLGAAVVLTAAGDAFLHARGRRELFRALGDFLAPWWDRVLLPRVWRTLSALPSDARGKTTLAAVQTVLQGDRPRAPELLDERRDPSMLVQRLRVPPDLAQLDGHFPGFPVVAGVVQLQWAAEAAAGWSGISIELAGVDALKFKDVLRPEQEFELRLQRAAPDRIDFTLSEGDRVFSSGRMRLRNDGGHQA